MAEFVALDVYEPVWQQRWLGDSVSLAQEPAADPNHIRARARTLGHAPANGDTTWYEWVAPRLYRVGLERPTREVMEDFLGRPVSPAALLPTCGG